MAAVEYAFNAVCGDEYEPVLTSGLEGTHSQESGHYHGRALDFRFPPGAMPEDLEEIRQGIEECLLDEPGQYLVLIEDNHFHVQRQKDSF